MGWYDLVHRKFWGTHTGTHIYTYTQTHTHKYENYKEVWLGCKGSDYYYYLSFTNKESKVQGAVMVDAGRE